MLAKHGSAANGAVAALTTALTDKDAGIRYWAADALRRIGRDAESAVPALRERLGDESTDVRARVWLALREIGGISDAEAISLLRDWQNSDSAELTSFAETKLRELGAPVDPPADTTDPSGDTTDR